MWKMKRMKPNVMGGKACIKGMRVTVNMIISHLAEGLSIEEMLKSFPDEVILQKAYIMAKECPMTIYCRLD